MTSTPVRRSFKDPIPSTTPLGPPPSTSKSVYNFAQNRAAAQGSSGSAGLSRGLFDSHAQHAPSSPPQPPFGIAKSGNPFWNNNQSFNFSAPLGRQPTRRRDDDDDNNNDRMEEDDDNHDDDASNLPNVPNLASSLVGEPIHRNIGGVKRSRSGSQFSNQKIKSCIRKGIAASNKPVLDEPDSFIIRTEAALEAFADEASTMSKNNLLFQSVLSQFTGEMLSIWDSEYTLPKSIIENPEYILNEDVPRIGFASTLAKLLVGINHPSALPALSLVQKSVPYASKAGFSSAKTIPEALLQWLYSTHEPGADVVQLTLSENNRAIAPELWDTLITLTLRGKFEQIVEIFETTDFHSTETDFTQPQLDYIDDALSLMTDLLEQSPVLQSKDWDVRNGSWSLFRHQVRQAKLHLRKMFEGGDKNIEILNDKSLQFSLSKSSRSVESFLPQTVYDTMNDMCNIILGDQTTIFNSCYDWIEGVLALTIWWDGEELEDLSQSTRQRRQHQTRQVDITPSLAYKERLNFSLLAILNDDKADIASSIKFNDLFHLGLCAILQSDVDSVIDILRTYSIVTASAVVQIASFAGWLNQSALVPETLRGLDESDLLVLSHRDGPKPGLKDTILSEYAELLLRRNVIASNESTYQGWEFTLSILARLDDERLKNKKASELLELLPLENTAEVNKVIETCNLYGFSDHASKVAEKFGDELAGSKTSYGDAMMYYAKSHNTRKIKELLHTLITISVVQSKSFPLKSELDETIATLLLSPNAAITCLNTDDVHANYILATYMSGYAAARKFYETRDFILAEMGSTEKSEAEKQADKETAVKTLLAMITAASDSIRGGLLDPRTNEVIPVDNLLVLLGETLIFFNHPQPCFTSQNLLTLIKVIEELETINATVFGKCETTFRAALADAHNDSSQVLSKLQAGIGGDNNGWNGATQASSSEFTMVTSSMYRSQQVNGNNTPRSNENSASSSGILVQGATVKRPAWDWRGNLHKDCSPEVVLRIIRVALAKEMGRAVV